MSLATLKAAGLSRENILLYAQDWAPAFFQHVADSFDWNDYTAITSWGNVQEQLEENAAAALLKW